MVWALRIWEASERRARGFGGSLIEGCGGLDAWRVDWKLWMRVVVEVRVPRRASKSLACFEEDILGFCTYARLPRFVDS